MNKIIVLTRTKLRAKIIKGYLNRVTNNTVYWSTSTDEVKKILKEEKISMVLSDVDLKDKTIFDFAKEEIPTELIAIVDKKNWNELQGWFEYSKLSAIKFPFSSIELLENINRNFDKVSL